MESASDAEIVRRSLEDPQVFGLVYDRHAATILRYLVRRVGRTTAEGLLGEVFHAAFEVRARFDPARASALPWLYGIASNRLFKHHRTEARRLRATARLGDTVAEGGAPDCTARIADARIVLERVCDVIEQLPAGERDVLLLHAWEDQGYAEIAEALDVPIGTVRSRLHRARRRLRERIDGTGEEKEESRSDEVDERGERRTIEGRT